MQNNIGEARRSYALLREDGKFSQEDAALFFGVSLSTYQKWEQGSGKLNGEILVSIADKYNCSVEYLLRRVNDPTFEPPAPSPVPYLSPDERELVDLYRRMDGASRDALMVIARNSAISSGVGRNERVHDDVRVGIDGIGVTV